MLKVGVDMVTTKGQVTSHDVMQALSLNPRIDGVGPELFNRALSVTFQKARDIPPRQLSSFDLEYSGVVVPVLSGGR